MIDKSKHGYNRPEAPLFAYFLFVLALLAVVVAGLIALGTGIERSISLLDMLLLGVAAHKIGWLLASDAVTSFLRAPFTRFVKNVGPGASFREEPRGSGFRFAMGEWITCPWCLDMWAAVILVLGFLFWPAGTRAIAAVFMVLMIADVLQLLYIWLGKVTLKH